MEGLLDDAEYFYGEDEDADEDFEDGGVFVAFGALLGEEGADLY